MVNKILVELYVPSVSKSFDVYVPMRLPLYQMMEVVSSALFELTGGKFIPSPDAVFCDKETGTIYDINMSAHELCFHNGLQLMII